MQMPSKPPQRVVGTFTGSILELSQLVTEPFGVDSYQENSLIEITFNPYNCLLDTVLFYVHEQINIKV